MATIKKYNWNERTTMAKKNKNITGCDWKRYLGKKHLSISTFAMNNCEQPIMKQ